MKKLLICAFTLLVALSFGHASSLEEDMKVVEAFQKKAKNLDAMMFAQQEYPQTAKATALKICEAMDRKDKATVLKHTHSTFKKEIGLVFDEKFSKIPERFSCIIQDVHEDIATGGTDITFSEPDRLEMFIVKEDGKFYWAWKESYEEYMYAAMPPYPEYADEVAIATCKTLKAKNWPEFLGYIHYEYTDAVIAMIKEWKGSEDFSNLSCEIQDASSKSGGIKRFHFDKIGNMDLKKIDGDWYVVRF